ncbi:GlxA family transcriptional regulator [Microbacterium allomyrinae]|uniref:Helix-turn-helix domain-containing protein n=1 Tax=Microbacterium allomyrinae TaxID=2830666 RepID=A0A9X1LXX9_9MICO|nr:helix-turn-helix domain-containing protein [Microbacterium allomyrinae]MCC2033380.1 helix-turn-helix domain-containing protein [Microbacterium allomyrinae]
MSRVPHRMAVLVLPGALPLDLAIPVQTFTPTHYTVTLCGQDPRVDASGMHIDRLAPLAALDEADTVIVPGYAEWNRMPSEAVLAALRGAHARGARLVSICTGAFALAAAGVLDRRLATTHWRAVDDLRRRFPLVDVRPAQLYIDDGDILTSAGVLAGLDLCLHIVRSDRGAAAANDRARALVAPPRRLGSQTAYRERLVPAVDSDCIADLCRQMLDRLDQPHRIDDLARAMHMSRRTFLRRFSAATGTTPLAWLTLARVDAARELLETTSDPVETVAQRTGLGSAAALRATFHRHVGASPSAYRAEFSRMA